MEQLARNRVAFSPREFAASFGRHPSWAYRLLYAQKIKAVTNCGRALIPASERDRLLESAKPYNPEAKGTSKAEAEDLQAAQTGRLGQSSA
jgi:hypothetical protein